jgi:hypothetical protein
MPVDITIKAKDQNPSFDYNSIAKRVKESPNVLKALFDHYGGQPYVRKDVRDLTGEKDTPEGHANAAALIFSKINKQPGTLREALERYTGNKEEAQDVLSRLPADLRGIYDDRSLKSDTPGSLMENRDRWVPPKGYSGNPKSLDPSTAVNRIINMPSGKEQIDVEHGAPPPELRNPIKTSFNNFQDIYGMDKTPEDMKNEVARIQDNLPEGRHFLETQVGRYMYPTKDDQLDFIMGRA